MTFFRVQLLVSVLLLAAGAHAAEGADAPSAQAADDARRAEAKARYEDGVQAYAAGRFKDAVDLFLAADKISPSAPLSFNIARAYEKLGDDSGTLRWYRDYLRRSPSAQNAAEVSAAIARYEARLAKKGVQQMTVLSTPSGATVSIDDSNLGVTPGTFDLPPGQHRVTLILRGYDDVSAQIELAPDRAQDVTLTLSRSAAPSETTVAASVAVAPAALPTAAPPPAPQAESAHRGLGVWPWVVTGAGVVALGGALTFELLRASAEEDAKSDPTQVGYKDKLDTMESRRTTARVLAGVGGALVVTGGVMLTLDLLGHKQRATAALALVPLAGGAATTLQGSF